MIYIVTYSVTHTLLDFFITNIWYLLIRNKFVQTSLGELQI